MSSQTSSAFMRDQYRNASNLNARIELHQRFSTNKCDWQRWVFDQLHVPAQGKVLEVGCGPGYLWTTNGDRLSGDWQIVLADLSPGMIRAARDNLHELLKRFDCAVMDIQAIPFDDATFDVVIANHMLYHVPDRVRALSEIQRILRAGGRFYAATNGQNHMREVFDLLQQFDPQCDADTGVTRAFNLENGAEQLSTFFSQVRAHHYRDALIVTEAEPLAAYIVSMQRSRLVEKRRDAFVRFLEKEMAVTGAIHIQKATGLFETHKSDGA